MRSQNLFELLALSHRVLCSSCDNFLHDSLDSHVPIIHLHRVFLNLANPELLILFPQFADLHLTIKLFALQGRHFRLILDEYSFDLLGNRIQPLLPLDLLPFQLVW